MKIVYKDCAERRWPDSFIGKVIQADSRFALLQIPDNSIDMIFIDPPYGHNNNSNNDLIHRWEVALGKGPVQEARPIQNDGEEANEIFRQVLPYLFRILKPRGVICCCSGGGGPDPQFARWCLWLNRVFSFKQAVVWDKGPIGMGWHYRRSYEIVLVASKGDECNWYDTSHKVENILRPGDYGIKKIIPRADDHPTAKPVELAEHFIRLHSKEGDIVLDCFAGRASTAIAAIRQKRRFIMIELNKKEAVLAERRIRLASGSDRFFRASSEKSR
jgi:DNA modification methylase